MKKHVNIPIFIPGKACPHQCVFCNQKNISGQMQLPSFEDIEKTIESYLQTVSEDTCTQIAFFGGSFTGIQKDEMIQYLGICSKYIESGKVEGIRISTRPDYISTEILDILKRFKVIAIELGAQSLDDEVLFCSARGHNRLDVINASNLIRKYDFELGLQMMLGLPGDTIEKSLYTANEIVRLGAHTTRIYPTLVITETHLEQLYYSGQYLPLSIEEAVKWSKEVLKVFLKNNIKVLRVGIHPSKDLDSGSKLLAGPYHKSFKELVLTEIWYDRILKEINKKSELLRIIVPVNEVNYAIGYNSRNKERLEQTFKSVVFEQSESLKDDEFALSYN